MVIAKSISRSEESQSSFKGLAYYLAGKKNTPEKVAKVWLENCDAGSDHDCLDAAVVEIKATQALNSRAASNKTYHLLISFREGERPEDDALVKIEKEFAKSLGLAEHQRLITAHHNTKNFHLHVAINKVHPKTLTCVSPSWDHYKLQECCRKIEQDYKLLPEPKKGQTLSPEAADFEAHTFQKSFMRYCLENKETILGFAESSKNWNDFHHKLARIGLAVKLRGNGLVFYQSKHHIKASSVDRSLSKNALTKRWGSFSPPTINYKLSNKKRYVPLPLVKNKKTRSLWKKYQKQTLLSNWKTFLLAYITVEDPLAATLITAHKAIIGTLLPVKHPSPNRTRPSPKAHRGMNLQPSLMQRRDLSKKLQSFLENKGFILDSPLLVDGKTHRIRIKGDAKDKQSGSYRAYGYPRPFISARNHQTGETYQWRQDIQSKKDDFEIEKGRKEIQEKEPRPRQQYLSKEFLNFLENKGFKAETELTIDDGMHPISVEIDTEGAQDGSFWPYGYTHPSKEYQSFLEDKELKVETELTIDGETHHIGVEIDTEGAQEGSFWPYDYTRPSISVYNDQTGETYRWRQEVQEKGGQPWHQDLSNEFRSFLENKGFKLETELIIDGEVHPISAENDTKGEQSGSYRAYDYPRPFITLDNYRTGETYQWYLHAERTTEEESEETKLLKEKGTKRANNIWKNNDWAPKDMSYFKEKQVPSLYIKHIEDTVIVPGRNLDTNKIQTLQFISPDGEKRFAKNAPKNGAMHLIDPEKTLSSKNDATLIVAEDYATAATLYMATRKATVCTLDSSNLKHVAQAFREKYPECRILIVADSNHSEAGNESIKQAEEAAKRVDGQMLLPTFSQEGKGKGLVSFNDLAKSSGMRAVKKQLSQKLQQSHTIKHLHNKQLDL